MDTKRSLSLRLKSKMTKIVLFKSESDGNDIFVEHLKKSNFIVRSIPSIDFVFKNIETLLKKLKKSDDYEGVIFTSPRSIIATQQALHSETDNDMKPWCDKKNFTVGESTYNLAKSLLSLETSGKEAGNAQNLSTTILNCYTQNNLSKPFLFPCGNLKQDILEKNLSEKSIVLDSVEVYDTIPHPNLERAIIQIKDEEDTDFIVFFSPSGIKYSMPFIKHHNLQLSTIKLIAIGPSTKRCMIDHDLECYAMCDKPSPESLLNVLNM